MPNPLYERTKEIVESIGMNIDPKKQKNAGKSKWKREVKTKIKKKN